jgi:hypothetical protein
MLGEITVTCCTQTRFTRIRRITLSNHVYIFLAVNKFPFDFIPSRNEMSHHSVLRHWFCFIRTNLFVAITNFKECSIEWPLKLSFDSDYSFLILYPSTIFSDTFLNRVISISLDGIKPEFTFLYHSLLPLIDSSCICTSIPSLFLLFYSCICIQRIHHLISLSACQCPAYTHAYVLLTLIFGHTWVQSCLVTLILALAWIVLVCRWICQVNKWICLSNGLSV